MNKKILGLVSQFLLVVSAASASPQGQNQRPNTQSGSQQSPNEVFRRDLYLTGKVVMADGSPMPEFLQVEMVCHEGVAPKVALTALVSRETRSE